MFNSGFPVPPGFVITAQAYTYLINSSGIRKKMNEILHETNVDDTKEFAKAMRRVFDDPYLRRILSENGRVAVQGFPSKQMYLDTYKTMWHTCGAKKK